VIIIRNPILFKGDRPNSNPDFILSLHLTSPLWVLGRPLHSNLICSFILRAYLSPPISHPPPFPWARDRPPHVNLISSSILRASIFVSLKSLRRSLDMTNSTASGRWGAVRVVTGLTVGSHLILLFSEEFTLPYYSSCLPAPKEMQQEGRGRHSLLESTTTMHQTWS